MRQYNIVGVAPQILSSIDTTFSINGVYGKVKLTLDNTGEYFLQTPYRVSEATAKRNPAYKIALSNITAKMLESYDRAVKTYTEIYKKSVSIVPEKKFHNRLSKLLPKKYTRAIFDIQKPLAEDAETLIAEETKSRMVCGMQNGQSVSLTDLYKQMEANWDKLIRYFDEVESILEKKNNEVYYQEYAEEKIQIENYIYGPDEFVYSQIDEICKTISSPEDIQLKFEYFKDTGVVSIYIHFASERLVNLTYEAASLYTTGKLSVKSKTKKDIEAEHSIFYSGVAFYISSLCFNISANVKSIRVSVTKVNSGLYWVEFNRNMFAKVRPYALNPVNTIVSLPNIIKLNTHGNIMEIPMDKFKKQVETQTMILDNSYLIGSDNSFSISISDAKLLCSYLKKETGIIDLIHKVEAIGGDTIFIEKKYENILKEIKQNIIDAE